MISRMSDPSPPTSAPPQQDSKHTIARNARYGLWLFAIYVAFYAGFVAISAFKFDSLRADVGGVNLAVAYGLGLIVLAFVLALVYMAMTRNESGGGGASKAPGEPPAPRAEGRA
jgi:uncharacterized membrane protein (DUF485 family)